MQEFSDKLAGFFGHHMCVLTALGKRRSSLHHKLRALTHALHMEIGDEVSTKALCRTIRGTTCDFGTELGLGFTAPKGDARKILHANFESTFLDDPSLQDGAQGSGMLSNKDADEIFGEALPVTGALYILHNAAKDARGI